MGTYLLKEGEVEVIIENPSWLMLLSHVILTVITFLIWLPVLIYYILRRTTTRYVITNMRVIREYGILSKSSKESPLDKINNVSHKQSLLGRILNYGDVQLQTASEMGATQFKFISAPNQFKTEIVNQMDLFKKTEVKNQAKIMAEALAASGPKLEQAEEYKICPFCAENIRKNATVCRYCNQSLDNQFDIGEQEYNLSASDWVKTGVNYYKNGEFEKAIKALNEAIKINPKQVSAFFNRGIVHKKLGDLNKALSDLKIAAKLGHPKALNLLRLKGYA